MKIFHFEPKSAGLAYSVLAETKEEAVKYIHEYTFQKALEQPFGLSNNGSHYLTGYLEEFIKWRYVPHKLDDYNMEEYDIGMVLTTSIE